MIRKGLANVNGNLIPYDFYIGPVGGAIDCFTFPMLECVKIEDPDERRKQARHAGYTDGFDLDMNTAKPSKMSMEIGELAARENDAKHHYESIDVVTYAQMLGGTPVEAAYATFRAKVFKFKQIMPGWSSDKRLYHEERKILTTFAGYVAGFAAGRADREASELYRKSQLVQEPQPKQSGRWT